ncbi:MAG: hypothetical protein PHW63_04895 [Alphaproteobacteria bacterium]|nr:hypothetical protein [Alphaproteobacteria bacterium]
MENQKTLAPANIQTDESLELFKQGVDHLLAKRTYFISQVLPNLQEGQDYYVIKGKKSLAKGGAEKLASIYNLVATFEKDTESLEMLGNDKGTVAFVCTLSRFGEIVGQGRGSDTMQRNGNDPNKTLKMCQKRSYVDAVIRSTGLSDIFTQDIEDMEPEQIENKSQATKPDKYESWMDDLEAQSRKPLEKAFSRPDNTITDKQKKLLISLANQKCEPEEREMLLESIDSMEKMEAAHVIKELIES